MITASVFAGKRYAVLGLARSGAAAAEALLASGADVTVWDRQDVAREPFEGRCKIADPLGADLTGLDGLVVSPGVPLNSHPIADHAAKYGVPVIGDIELFAQARAELPMHMVVGITGTNGKSTTTALVHHMMETAGVPSLMAGNIGIPILEQDPLPEGGTYVLELSSYQIDLTQSLDCDVAVLLNITPDHLDRYDGSFEKYAASKARLFTMQDQDQVAIVSEGDPAARRVAEQLVARSPERESDLFVASTETAKELGWREVWPALQGPHNAQNVAAAIEAAFACGIDHEPVHQALLTFTGLPHRMELVSEAGGVTFINDSKATNTASAAPALAAFPPDPAIHGGAPRVHWIVGGLAKEDGLGECERHLARVAAAYTVGEAGPRFAELLEGRVPRVERCELVSEAVRRASEAAQKGDVVLFSPACASFDQFRDYEKRGEHFRQLVGVLAAPAEEGDPQ